MLWLNIFLTLMAVSLIQTISVQFPVYPTCGVSNKMQQWYLPDNDLFSYVRLTKTIDRPLESLTACAWSRFTTAKNTGSVLSYATVSNDNTFLLWLSTNEDNDIMAEVWCGNEKDTKTDVIQTGVPKWQWIHLCFAWNAWGGNWTMYSNGKKVGSGSDLSNNKPLNQGGVLLLGQDQDSLAGGFQVADSCFCRFAGVNFYNYVLSKEEVMSQYNCCFENGNVASMSHPWSYYEGVITETEGGVPCGRRQGN